MSTTLTGAQLTGATFKDRALDLLIALIEDELAAATRAAQTAHEEATHDESRAEGQYDTRGLEAGYLAQAQASRAVELLPTLQLLKNMKGAPFTQEVIGHGALVQVRNELGSTSHYLVATRGGGRSVKIDGQTVRIITPYAPVGEALLGRKVSDSLEFEASGKAQVLEIVGIA